MAACIPPGMPRMMIGYGGGFEFLITPEVTYAIQASDDAIPPHLHRWAELSERGQAEILRLFDRPLGGTR